MAASHKVASYAFMNPVLWESLPRELLLLVLARLPVPEITRLRCQLSKEWTINREFNRACDEVNPNMAAVLSDAGKANKFSVRIFSFSKFVWLYVYRFHVTHRGNAASRIESVWMPMASDGGLVCFVSTWNYTEANPLCIVVINPLTRVQHELPALQHVYTVPPTLVHMKVDSRTKEYKVVVIDKKNDCYTIETYDSVSRQWSKAAPSWGCILGHAREWKIGARNCFRLKSSSLCAYDLEEGQLKLLDCNLLFRSEGACVKQYLLVGDRMIVVQKKLNRHGGASGFYFITEFQSQNSAEVWVPVRTHGGCFPGAKHWSLHLHACEDVLMFRNPYYRTNQFCWFLNFSTSRWHNLPEKSPDEQYVPMMCRVFWNVVP